MIRRVLNRLSGRTDSSVDAVNAYVEGNASADETKLVENMMRENPALENDLATQTALREVLGRVGTVEAPRSFAITPEMVAASERSDSGLSKLTELFAPQRKLAMAPAVVAAFAALTVALLTLGDIAGVVEQSPSGGDDSASTAAIAESAAAPMAAGDPESGVPAAGIGGGIAAEPEIESEIIVTEKADSAASDGGAAMATSVGSEAPVEAAAATAPGSDDSAIAEEAPMAPAAGGSAVEPPSAAMPAPEPTPGPNVEFDGSARSSEPDPAEAVAAEQIAEDGDSANSALGSFASTEDVADAEAQANAFEQAATDEDGISLPLWQLQVALTALALAAIGAWAGARRVRGE